VSERRVGGERVPSSRGAVRDGATPQRGNRELPTAIAQKLTHVKVKVRRARRVLWLRPA